MSSSFGGGGSGDINYVITVDDSQVPGKLQSVSQSLKGVATTSQQVSQEVGKFSQANADLAAELMATDIGVKEVTKSQQSFGSFLKQNILSVTTAASGIISLVQQYSQLQRVANKLEQSQNSEIALRNRVSDLRAKEIQAINEYGKNSEEAARATRNREQAERKLNTLAERNVIMQEQYNQRVADFAVNILPQMIGIGGSLGQVVIGYKEWRLAAQEAGVATRGLGITARQALIGTGIGAIIVTIGTALVAFTQNWYGFRDAVNAVGVELGNFAGGILKPVLGGIQAFGNILTGLLGGEVPQTAEAAVAAIDDIGETTEKSTKETKQLEKQYDELWKTLGEAPLLSDALDIKIDKTKLTEKLLDYLPDSMSKEIKLYLETKQSVQVIRDSFEETIAAASELNYDDAKIDKIVNQTIKLLGEKFPDSPQAELMRKQLGETVAGEDTLTKVRTLIQNWNIPLDSTFTPPPEGFELSDAAFDAEFAKVGKVAGAKIGASIPAGISAGLVGNPDLAKNIGNPINNAFAASILNRDFWIQVGITTLGFVVEGIQRFEKIKMGLAGFVKAILDRDTWVGIGITALGFIVEGIQKIEPLINAGKVLGGAIMLGIQSLTDWGTTAVNWMKDQIITNVDKIWQAGKDLAGQIWEGMKNFFSTVNIFDILPKIETDPNKLDKWDPLTGKYTKSLFGVPGTPGDFNLFSKDIMGQTKDEYGRDMNPPKGMYGGGIQGYGAGTDFENKLISMGAANPLDTYARQIVQITKNLNTLARAIVTVTKDYNQLARATVTVTKDNNQLARTITQVTRNNNQLARTTVTVTKDNNQLARTIVTVTKDNNQLAKTQVQITKNNNTLARTIVQVGKNFDSAASDAKSFASALKSVASAARSAASAIRSIPKPPSGVQRFAKGGNFVTDGPELIMVGDNPGGKERVTIQPLSGSPAGRYMYSGQSNGNGAITLNIVNKLDGNEIINTRYWKKQLKYEIGKDPDRFL